MDNKEKTKKSILEVTDDGNAFAIRVDKDAFEAQGLEMDFSSEETRNMSILSALMLVMVPGIVKHARNTGRSFYETYKDFQIAFADLFAIEAQHQGLSEEDADAFASERDALSCPLVDLFLSRDDFLVVRLNPKIGAMIKGEDCSGDHEETTNIGISLLCGALSQVIAMKIDAGEEVPVVMNYTLSSLANSISDAVPGVEMGIGEAPAKPSRELFPHSEKNGPMPS